MPMTGSQRVNVSLVTGRAYRREAATGRRGFDAQEVLSSSRSGIRPDRPGGRESMADRPLWR
jgi:hypothetical protein